MVHKIVSRLFRNKNQRINLLVFTLTLFLLTLIRVFSGIRLSRFSFNLTDWLYSDILLSVMTMMFGNLLSSISSKIIKKPMSCRHAHCDMTNGNSNWQIVVILKSNNRSSIVVLRQQPMILPRHNKADIAFTFSVFFVFSLILICGIAAFVLYLIKGCPMDSGINIAIVVIFILNAVLTNSIFNYVTRSSRCCGF